MGQNSAQLNLIPFILSQINYWTFSNYEVNTKENVLSLHAAFAKCLPIFCLIVYIAQHDWNKTSSVVSQPKKILLGLVFRFALIK